MDDNNVCGSCKYWLLHLYGGGNAIYGLCAMSKMNHPMMRSGCGLKTRADFGCRLYEKKKEPVKEEVKV